MGQSLCLSKLIKMLIKYVILAFLVLQLLVTASPALTRRTRCCAQGGAHAFYLRLAHQNDLESKPKITQLTKLVQQTEVIKSAPRSKLEVIRSNFCNLKTCQKCEIEVRRHHQSRMGRMCYMVLHIRNCCEHFIFQH